MVWSMGGAGVIAAAEDAYLGWKGSHWDCVRLLSWRRQRKQIGNGLCMVAKAPNVDSDVVVCLKKFDIRLVDETTCCTKEARLPVDSTSCLEPLRTPFLTRPF